MVELHTLVEDKDTSVSSVNQTMNAFELTVTQEFQGLKISQTEIAVKVRESTDVYNQLKDLRLDPTDPRPNTLDRWSNITTTDTTACLLPG